jgi:hypothetical protein
MITTAENVEFRELSPHWTATKQMLTGKDVRQQLRRGFFEPKAHFTKRKAVADFRPLTRDIISRLVGQLFERRDDIERELGPLSETDIERIGPKGESWTVLMMKLAEYLLAYNSAVIVLRPEIPSIYVETPLVMPRWTSREAIITSETSRTENISRSEEKVPTWTVYTPVGWQVYTQQKKKDSLEDEGFWRDESSFFVDRDGFETPPVVRAEMPWTASFGQLVAESHAAIYRMESQLDFAAAGSLHGLIQLGVGSDESLAGSITEALEEGRRFIPYDKTKGEHQPLALPTAGLEMTKALLETKREHLYETSYQSLTQIARSATEAAINHQSGPAAALSVLGETMASVEERVLSLLAQANDMTTYAGPAPQDPGISVTYPSDFATIDIEG